MIEAEPFGTYAPRGLPGRLVRTTRRLGGSWFARRLTILLRRIAMARLSGAPVDVEALGCRLRVWPYNNICEKRMLFSPQLFDPVELDILARRIRPGFVFVDVGANVGAYSLFVAARADGASRILAVEPQPDIHRRLLANIALNGFSTITPFGCALADRSGELTLFIDERNSGSSSLKVVGSDGSRAIKVEARTLLGLLRDEGLERVDAVKFDIEGAEDLVLEPFLAEAAPALLPGLLIIENAAERWQTDLEALLLRHGYRSVARTRHNLVFERGDDAP